MTVSRPVWADSPILPLLPWSPRATARVAYAITSRGTSDRMNENIDEAELQRIARNER
jgi:hypothetical protein